MINLNKKGFTLIELISVLIVLSLVLVLVIPNIVYFKNTGADAIKKGKINTLTTLAKRKTEEDIDNYQDCTGTISNNNLSKCIFKVTDLMSEEEDLKGNIYICFDNFKLEANAYYSENTSYTCS